MNRRVCEPHITHTHNVAGTDMQPLPAVGSPPPHPQIPITANRDVAVSIAPKPGKFASTPGVGVVVGAAKAYDKGLPENDMLKFVLFVHLLNS